MQMTDKEYKELVRECALRFDVVYDTYCDMDYTEIKGSTGGDVYALRIYKTGLVCEK